MHHVFPLLTFVSDAPAISDIERSTIDTAIVDNEASQWDDEALAAASTSTAHAIALTSTGTSNAAELLDIKALEIKGQDDIAERMRLEETKAALAAAREGMEREGQRLKLKEEEEKKKGPSGRFSSAAAVETSFQSSNWVPPHRRSGASSSLGRGRASQKLDTQDESLFPDLKEADKILQQEKKHDAAVVYKVPKKTAVGGGATWGSRPVVPKTAPAPKQETGAGPPAPAPVVVAPAPPVVAQPAPAPLVAPIVAPTTTLADPKLSVGAGLKKKKKKKDLSTFKP
jgi:hypothetical protein